MYQPPHFREDRLEVQHALIRTHSLGALVSAGEGGLVANHVPMILDPGASELGTLRCHLARANPQWRDLAAGAEALVIFQGPQAYVTPSWYETKRETHKVVPTWNYAVVHAWGAARVIEDEAWLAEQIAALTAAHEAPRPEPWAVSDAPAPFVAAQIRGIVGVEIPIRRIEGKWKVSQNRPVADRVGVAEGIRSEEPAMADLVEAYGAAR
ncbi:FMN-binding negative transcriptional regulator [Salinarimonas soli]|uniref:FMN-binding negative transcriptional regulator n=1 Tax=Salinarimonas soli TaxID=1638099 RepID=A0A5B2VBA6_9HYPH|nr:FMN-binding negative transcriptional regulator [Salinarimonas soli]KAA2236254.1 FMN-binding negative transcriptional regulator [Salinarimonas soli]